MPVRVSVLPMPALSERLAGERVGQLKPDDSSRWATVAGKPQILRWDFNLPLRRCGLRDSEREGGFRELNESRAIGPGGEQEVAGNLRRIALRMPHSLTLLHGPTGLGNIDFRQRWSADTTGQRNETE